MKVSVVVTTYKTISLLKRYLLDVIKTSSRAFELIVADDCSGDGSVEYVAEMQKKYPFIKILSQPKNVRFGKNSNDAVSMAKGDLVVMLNSDISPKPGYIESTLKHFKDPKVFGVGLSEEKNDNYGSIFWKNGYIQIKACYSNHVHETAWLSGGSSIVRKELYQKLKGFDPIYIPGYFEDLDLGFRAWKSGYKLLWEPTAKVLHLHKGSMQVFSKHYLDKIKERNHLLTVWRNITNPKLVRENRIAQIGRVLTGPNYIKIILAAKKQIRTNPPPVVFPQITDLDVFNIFNK